MRRVLVLVAAAGCASAPPPPPARLAALAFPIPGAHECSRGFRPAEGHFGLDVPAPPGTPVLASARGVVVRASGHPTYGLAVVIRHARLVYTLYAHLSAVAVRAGDEVEARTKVGEVGATGNARGPHLHFE